MNTIINNQEFRNRRVGSVKHLAGHPYAHHVGHSPTYTWFLLARLKE
ncbi:MAG: hypothetical protein Q7J38_14815 [Gallionella sp.]|nr:hypothetical protein [Gallionella sp.]